MAGTSDQGSAPARASLERVLAAEAFNKERREISDTTVL
jgi:hypothetical protein